MLNQRPSRWDKNRPIFLQIGIIASLVVTYGIFHIEGSKQSFNVWDHPIIEETLIIPDRTTDLIPKKKIPKPESPKTPNIILDLKEAVKISEQSEIIKTEIKNFHSTDILAGNEISNPPVVVPNEIIEEEDIPIRFADRMPIFGDCFDEKASESDRKSCSNDALLKYLYEHLKYPAIARENGIEGQVVLRFVVRKNGQITDIEIVRDIGAGCGSAAKNVVKEMPHWIPGKQNGRPISVYFTLPVRFKLEG